MLEGFALALALRGEAAPISWEAPASCPSSASLLDEVRRLLGGADPDLSSATIEARVEPLDDRFQMTLSVVTPVGTTTRSMDAQACETLVATAALYIAMAVDPVTAVAAAAPDPEPEPEPQPQPQANPEFSASQLARPSRRSFGLRAAGGVSLGAYPQPGGVASLVGSWRLGSVRLELAGHYARWRPMAVVSDASPEASLQAGFVEARLCPGLRHRAVAMRACAGVQVGFHRGRGVAVDRRKVALGVGTDAVLGPAIAWWITDAVALWAEPDMVVSVMRPRFVVEGVPGALTHAAVAARVSVGVHVRLWEGGRG